MRRWVPLLVLLLLLSLALAMGWHRSLSWAALRANHALLTDFIAQHAVLGALGFFLLYTVVVALAIPGGAVISVAGGMLFGVALGTVLAALGATAGAVLLFLAARAALAEKLARHFAPLARRLQPRLARDGFSYLLAVRCVGVVPFVLPTLAAALAGMRLVPFAVASCVGIVPSTLVLTGIGAGLGDILTTGETMGVASLLTPGVLLPLLGLAGLALLPVAWRRWNSETA